jgi:NADH:ubiquinone oxidoreductase subunit 5 (subunit L)/multisubunit Na+/H+ antiporter MnhA subunit
MAVPLWILAALTVLAGVFSGVITTRVVEHGEAHAAGWLAALSLALAAGGLLLAWALYSWRVLDPARLRAWAAWDVRFGILDRPPDVARAFDFGLSR